MKTLFGSFARYEQQEDSDIDILIELQDKTPNIYELKNELREFIGNRFQRQVDIAREKYLKPSFRQRILKETIYVGERQTESGKYAGSDSKN
ncbi:MAG: nucleotidyltransferase domain-containing protein [Candidatus Vecturithrix sp.]|jgi:predicted nucleotidyltransferase|nr:nucleotidyltransferase domain-containing protein [Candidatus Vecturithrix sp.]